MENKNIAYYENESVGAITLNAKTPEHIWNVMKDELGEYLK
jgi:hypothetical protein